MMEGIDYVWRIKYHKDMRKTDIYQISLLLILKTPLSWMKTHLIPPSNQTSLKFLGRRSAFMRDEFAA